MPQVYVGDIVPGTTEHNLRSLFSQVGQVKDVTLKGKYAFIEYGKEEAVDRALQLNGVELLGGRLKVKPAYNQSKQSTQVKGVQKNTQSAQQNATKETAKKDSGLSAQQHEKPFAVVNPMSQSSTKQEMLVVDNNDMFQTQNGQPVGIILGADALSKMLAQQAQSGDQNVARQKPNSRRQKKKKHYALDLQNEPTEPTEQCVRLYSEAEDGEMDGFCVAFGNSLNLDYGPLVNHSAQQWQVHPGHSIIEAVRALDEGAVRDGPTQIYPLWQHLLRFWLWGLDTKVYIVTPFLDFKCLEDIRQFTFASSQSYGRSSLYGVYTREMCDGTRTIEQLKAQLLQSISNAHHRGMAEKVLLPVFTVPSKTFHCKFIAAVKGSDAEVLLTSANFHSNHFDVPNNETVSYIRMSQDKFYANYLDPILEGTPPSTTPRPKKFLS